jgi:hypothetical protein
MLPAATAGKLLAGLLGVLVYAVVRIGDFRKT